MADDSSVDMPSQEIIPDGFSDDEYSNEDMDIIDDYTFVIDVAKAELVKVKARAEVLRREIARDNARDNARRNRKNRRNR